MMSFFRSSPWKSVWRGFPILGCVLALSCASQEDFLSPGTPDPEVDDGPTGFEGEPPFTFRVYRTDVQGNEALRWQGTIDGPSLLSPEPTVVPYVGYGQTFRIEWQTEAVEDRIFGTFFKPADNFRNWAVSSTAANVSLHSFTFENSALQEDLNILGCGEDLDCIRQLYLIDTEYRFEVGGTNAVGTRLAFAEGLLRIRIGFPPPTVFEGLGRDREYFAPDGSGPFSFADGDTLPSGSRVVVHTRVGTSLDLPAGADPDSMCCNVNPPGWSSAGVAADLRFRGEESIDRTEFRVGSRLRSAEASHEFIVGPFEYELRAGATDHMGVVDPTPLLVMLRGGLAPTITSLLPSDGAHIVLRNPADSEPWPENDLPYEVSASLTAYWTGERFVETDLQGIYREVFGNYYYLPMRIAGVNAPREPANGPRGFAFEWSAPDSVGNLGPESPFESDLSRSPRFHTSAGIGEFELVWDDRVRVFIPTHLWIVPERFYPGSIDSGYMSMGEMLRRQLGTTTLTAMCRTTAETELYGTPRDLNDPSSVLASFRAGPFGRRSEIASTTFSVRLGLDPLPATGTIQSYFPPLEKR